MGIVQARILEWVAIYVFRGSSQPRDPTRVSCVASIFFTNLKIMLRNHYTLSPGHSRCSVILPLVISKSMDLGSKAGERSGKGCLVNKESVITGRGWNESKEKLGNKQISVVHYFHVWMLGVNACLLSRRLRPGQQAVSKEDKNSALVKQAYSPLEETDN